MNILPDFSAHIALARARLPLAIAALCSTGFWIANASPPLVTNVRAAQRPGTHYIDIYYNVSSANSPLTVYVVISADGGTTWNVPVFTTQGAVGPGVTPGNDRHIQWNAGADWPGQFNSQCKVRITADDGTAPPAPAEMVYIPGGVFQMGDPLADDGATEQQHNVYISSFFMDRYLVTRELWMAVYSYAMSSSYSFDNSGSYRGTNHPVHTITWYDAVKWCNARSQREGLTPCYYTDASQTNVYRTGGLNLTNGCVKWSANGYRLPTEAEWEKAARGGVAGWRFPWGNLITHSNANYNSSSSFSYDVSSTRDYHPVWYAGGGNASTSPVDYFAPNGFGLYDMAGNVWQWCWDWYDSTWYGNPQALVDDTRGPASGSYRLLRGGTWLRYANSARCANRFDVTPSSSNDGYGYSIGFRCVRGL
jgi:formylglycine-generating enzyme